MLQVEEILSFADVRLLPYRNMRQQVDHAAQKIFVAEGDKVVRRLLESDLTILSVLLPTKRLEEFTPLLQARGETVPVFAAEMKILEQLTGFKLYQGVLAVAKIPDPVPLDQVFRNGTVPRLLIALDELSNAENIGSLARNGAAFGAQALLVGETCSTPFMRRAVRISMGTIFQLPCVHPANLANALRELHQHGVKCVAAHPHAAQSIFETDFSGDCCLVFGSEGAGISASVLAACDEAVAIPMSRRVDSLNVSCAAAAFFCEIARQRQFHRVKV